ncbi:serine/threonine-protein kinase [Mycolicibacterium pulveris]|uniref:serine/threonine-protein kinase n=1 Tax=Mycolicibacterium pulveris TaxID=36813 RepID=UPI003CF7E925
MDDTPQRSRVGSRFGPYQIKRLIGRGGMGEVYEAEDTVKGRTVALKLLPDALSGDPVFRERLQREARSAGRLQEPHVVPIHDYGEIDGHLFVDMRLIDGIDLRTALQRDGAMAPAQAVGLIRQIAAALDAAHDAGVMHRDVKPENILVTRDGFAYLVDFGIASATTDRTLTEKGAAIGTYAYMAPERFSSEPVTHRADIYALACVLHQCLTAAQPYPADSVSVLITAHLMEPPPRPSQLRPDIPPAFDAVIEKGMAKRAEDRYASAGELARAAEAALGTQHPEAPGSWAHATLPAGVPTPAPRRGGRWPLVIGGAAALAVVVALAGVVTWLVARSPGNASGMSETLTITRTVARGPHTPIETTAALTADERKLLSMVADPGTCTPNKLWSDAVAAVDCAPASTGDGHDAAFYALYGDADTLESQFQDVIADDVLTACPGADDSPTNWNYDDGSDDAEGSLACGTSDGTADIVWTNTSDLLLGIASGRELNRLYHWWVNTA